MPAVIGVSRGVDILWERDKIFVCILNENIHSMFQFVPQRTLANPEEEAEESPWFLDIEMLEVFQLILVVFFILAM